MAVVIPIDPSEAMEACALFAGWYARREELPIAVRDRLLEALATPGFDIRSEGTGLAVVLTPALRALVADLRARETGQGKL